MIEQIYPSTHPVARALSISPDLYEAAASKYATTITSYTINFNVGGIALRKWLFKRCSVAKDLERTYVLSSAINQDFSKSLEGTAADVVWRPGSSARRAKGSTRPDQADLKHEFELQVGYVEAYVDLDSVLKLIRCASSTISRHIYDAAKVARKSMVAMHQKWETTQGKERRRRRLEKKAKVGKTRKRAKAKKSEKR